MVRATIPPFLVNRRCMTLAILMAIPPAPVGIMATVLFVQIAALHLNGPDLVMNEELPTSNPGPAVLAVIPVL